MDFLRDVGQRGVWALVRLSITFLDYPAYGRGTGRIVYLVYVASSQISDLTECPGVSERSVYPAL